MDPIKGHLNNSNQRYNQEKKCSSNVVESTHMQVLTAGENADWHISRDSISEIEGLILL